MSLLGHWLVFNFQTLSFGTPCVSLSALVASKLRVDFATCLSSKSTRLLIPGFIIFLPF